MNRELAKDVYYSSKYYSPESVFTCGGYFFLAEVFLAENQADLALAMMDKVVDIWYKYLASLRTSQQTDPSVGTDSEAVGPAQAPKSIISHTRPDNSEDQLPDTVVVEVEFVCELYLCCHPASVVTEPVIDVHAGQGNAQKSGGGTRTTAGYSTHCNRRSSIYFGMQAHSV